MQGDAGGKIQWVALFLSARTQQHAGRANFLGIVRHNVTVLLCQQLKACRRLLKQAVVVQHAGIAALRRKHLLALCKGRTVGDHRLGHGAALGRSALIGQHQHVRRQLQADLGQVGGAMALEHIHAFHDLQTVADVMAQRGVHIGDHGGNAAAMVGTDGDHQLGQLNALVYRFHKSSGAGGHIQQDGIRAGSQLFGHDAGRNERDAADSCGHIPQGIHLFIGNGNSLALTNDRQADPVHLRKELLLREGGSGAGHALHLIDGAAGMAKAPAAHLGDLHAAGCDDRCNDQRGLVTHAASGVLVHLDARNGRKIHHHTAVSHHIGQLCGLLIGHAAQIDSHHPCSHLVISHFSADIAIDDLLQLLTAVRTAITLFCDQIINAHRITLLVFSIVRHYKI